MKFFLVLSATMLLSSFVSALDLESLHASDVSGFEVPVPTPAKMAMPTSTLDNKYLCRTGTCYITTRVTNVCSDGKHFDTQKTENRSTGKPEYKDKSLKKWADYQRSIGKDTKWKDRDHQDAIATGHVDSIQTAYVVVPAAHRELLHSNVNVCVAATGKCITAKALEIGPAFGELSVGAMMKLGLNSHPSSGQYTGRITYTFTK
jgi:hypothetical protein